MANPETDNTSPLPPETPDEFGRAWRRFMAALRQLLSEPQDQRAFDVYLSLRNATVDALEDPKMVAELQRAWATLHSEKVSPNAAHLLLMELQAFPAAVEVKDNEEKTSKQPNKSLWKRLLGVGGTTIDSTRELLEALPLKWKAILKVGKEIIDILRGE